MNMKLLLTALALSTALVASAKDATPKRKYAPGEVQAKLYEMHMKRTGGYVFKENSSKGKVVFFNSGNEIGAAALADALRAIERTAAVDYEIINIDSVDLKAVSSTMAKFKAQGAIFLVKDPILPRLLVAPEDGWALVNMTALDDGSGDKKVQVRATLEIVRGFALALGAASARQGAVVMTDVASMKDLDSIVAVMYGAETASKIKDNIQNHGIVPRVRATYRKACEEGWAASPTNDYQKAIWEEVRSIPNKPLKIRYTPKNK